MRCGAFVRFGLGILGWSVVEYLTHRFPMHGRRGSTPLADEHLDHHADPLQARPLRLDVHNLAYKGAGFGLATIATSPLVACGFTVGYAGYTHLHHQIHHRGPRSSWERALWRHHHVHHFSGPGRNYGVTSSIWDHLLGSHRSVTGPVSVSAKRAPSWMETDHDYRVIEAPRVSARRNAN